jgi:ABC-type Fe3+-siderophore transport system permease subunit
METLSRSNRKKKNWTLGLTIALAIFVSVFTLFVGSSNMSLADGFAALFRQGSDTNIRIIWNIRIPRDARGDHRGRRFSGGWRRLCRRS